MPRVTTTSTVAGVEYDHGSSTPARERTSSGARFGGRAEANNGSPHGVVFLIDVDNTLLDNDHVISDLTDRLELELGVEGRDRYWEVYEALRAELGYADYLGALQRFRVNDDDGDPRLPRISSYLLDYPFAERLYPGALACVAHLGRLGVPVILSDGDVVLQPRKIERSGLWDAVAGRVLIYIHKEKVLDDVERRYPARHYVMIDDKVRVLTAMKQIRGDRLTTVLPQQGHYALDPKNIAGYPAPDVTIERIGDLVNIDLPTLRGAAQGAQRDKEAP
jgi:FMN phosphatase YigB (HAD superfamily)